jgi:hypothetical protein
MLKDFALNIKSLLEQKCLFYDKENNSSYYIDIKNPEIIAVYETKNYKITIEYSVEKEDGEILIESSEKIKYRKSDLEFEYYKSSNIRLDERMIRELLDAFISSNIKRIEPYIDREEYEMLESFTKEANYEISRKDK